MCTKACFISDGMNRFSIYNKISGHESVSPDLYVVSRFIYQDPKTERFGYSLFFGDGGGNDPISKLEMSVELIGYSVCI